MKARAMLFCAALASFPAAASPLELVLSVASAAFKLNLFSPSSVVVVAEGSGATQEKATEAAVLASVRQVAGAVVIGEEASSGDALVRDIGIQYAGGTVSKYDVLSCMKSEAGLYRCRIKAVVSTKRIVRNVVSGEASTGVDGDALFAQHVSAQGRIEQGRKLVGYMLGSIKTSAIDLTITNVAPKPVAGDHAVLMVSFEAKMNGEAVDSVNDVMDRISSDTEAFPVDASGGGLQVDTTWTSARYPIRDQVLVSSIVASLRSQQDLDVKVSVIDGEDTLIHAYCYHYRTVFYGGSPLDVMKSRMELADFLNRWTHSGPMIKADHAENQTAQLGMSLYDLKRVNRVTVTVGCQEPSL